MANKLLKIVASKSGDDNGKPKKVFQTQAEVDAANQLAKNMAVRRGLISGENTYVARKPGDPMPQFTDMMGRPYTAPAEKPKTWFVPNHIKREDIQTHNGNAWYTDPQTGDIVDIDLNVLNTPRFRLSSEKVKSDAADRTAKLAIKKSK